MKFVTSLIVTLANGLEVFGFFLMESLCARYGITILPSLLYFLHGD